MAQGTMSLRRQFNELARKRSDPQRPPRCPEFQEQFRSEIHSTLGAGNENVPYDSMPLLNAFIKETLRLFPAEPVDRIAIRDTVISLSESKNDLDWRTYEPHTHSERPACDTGDCLPPFTYRFAYIDWNHDGVPTHMSSSPHNGLEGRLTTEKRLVHTRV
ncbi:hypothetical protein C8R44DRAFT_735036 [Mycena epipterygia]|nr:hypothetical protein C8R44DRAFT_735036 [Mycena epipterygia]